MSVQPVELVWRKPEEVSDVATNGGKMSDIVSITTAKNNIFPDVGQAERDAGVPSTLRKMHILVNNAEGGEDSDTGLNLVSPRVYVEQQTPGDDMVVIFPGDHDNTQATAEGGQPLYGAGKLDASVIATATVLTVEVEDWSQGDIFRPADTIRISDKTDINDAINNEEFHVIAAGGVSDLGSNVIQLTLETPLAFGYDATDKVSSVYEPGLVKAEGNNVQLSGAGGFVEAGISTDNTGTVFDTWTLTFTGSGDSTTFDISGQFSGALTSGATTTDYISGVNIATGGKYFILRSASFSGTWQAGDSLTFDTIPAAIPIWYKRIIPALATSLSGNSVKVAIDGESS